MVCDVLYGSGSGSIGPSLRFPFPLIEPDVRYQCIRLHIRSYSIFRGTMRAHCPPFFNQPQHPHAPHVPVGRHSSPLHVLDLQLVQWPAEVARHCPITPGNQLCVWRLGRVMAAGMGLPG